jgi:hypothetical protein
MAEPVIPRLTAPPYVPITINEVWGEVKSRWSDIYSAEKSCPADIYGPPGGERYEACRKALDATWEKIKKELPDYPSGGPYNPPVDLVSVEDICYVASHPEEEGFPDMFSDLGALARRLQESYKRRIAPKYCEAPANTSPGGGGCTCMPYFVTTNYETRQVPGEGVWTSMPPTTTPAWGPIGGVSVENRTVSDEHPLGGYAINIDSQGGILNLFNGWNCQPNRIKSLSAGSNGGEARLTGSAVVRQFSLEECLFYFGSVPEGYPGIGGECPVPYPPVPSSPMPNTEPYFMPLPLPSLNFPVLSPGCPEETNVLEIRVVYEDGVGPAGPKGEKGEDGKPGETTMRRRERTSGETLLGELGAVPSGDIVCHLPVNSGFIRIDWLASMDFPRRSDVRQFHESRNDGKLDEFQMGRIFLAIVGEDGWFSPYLLASKNQTLIEIPDYPGIQLKISVTDVYGVGVRVVDLGYRWKDFRWSNPESIPAIEYSA